MRFGITIALVFICLLFAGCDAVDLFGSQDGGPSQAQEVGEAVRPFVPNGLPRVLLDIVLGGLAVVSAYTAKKSSDKKAANDLAHRHKDGYSHAEAEAMLTALNKLKDAGSDLKVS